jgi:hypothetical protein
MPPRPEPTVDRYRPLSTRRRLLFMALAVATAVGVVLLLLDPPGGVQRKRPVAPPPAPCTAGQTVHCVGGTVEVLAPAPIAPTPGSPASR